MTAPLSNLAVTWNNGATVFTAIKMNVTDTASDAASLLMDLQVGSASKFKVNKLGGLTISGADSTYSLIAGTAQFRTGAVLIGFQSGGGTDGAAFGTANAALVYGGISSIGMAVSSDLSFGFTSGNLNSALDLALRRDAAGILAQRNGVNAQTFRLYNSFTDAANYERGVFDWNATANVLTIGAEAAGTGTGRNVSIKSGAVSWLLAPNVDNTSTPALYPNSTSNVGLKAHTNSDLVFGSASNNYFRMTAFSAGGVINSGNSYLLAAAAGGFGFSGAGGPTNSADTVFTRGGVATIQFGAEDLAVAIAQTMQAQSIKAGTSNTAGQDWVFQGSRGTGAGAGGNLVFKAAPAGSTGTAQNAAAAMFTVRSDKTIQLNNSYTVATLPAAGSAGRMAYVTDAAAPTFLGALTGGGAVVTPVFDNGTAWVSF